MDDSDIGAIERGAAFIDLENLGLVSASERTLGRLRTTLRDFKRGLLACGIDATLWATACEITPSITAVMNENLKLLDTEIHWSTGIADIALTDEIARRLVMGTLPGTVVIVSGDSDFLRIASQLQRDGRRVIIAAPETSVSRRVLNSSMMRRLEGILQGKLVSPDEPLTYPVLEITREQPEEPVNTGTPIRSFQDLARAFDRGKT
jgi:hypothetical protein